MILESERFNRSGVHRFLFSFPPQLLFFSSLSLESIFGVKIWSHFSKANVRACRTSSVRMGFCISYQLCGGKRRKGFWFLVRDGPMAYLLYIYYCLGSYVGMEEWNLMGWDGMAWHSMGLLLRFTSKDYRYYTVKHIGHIIN
ncbi:hypothetical protein EYC80_010081 [Monilinia laxa]|uniref:Uncharacterized protein n=1 Tax=Monilinia laxa TaxID=61186 RepID=A0A5N6JU71_MONLA|nr:hypothetical protein EYC80_010081 [Monilinia laxa]